MTLKFNKTGDLFLQMSSYMYYLLTVCVCVCVRMVLTVPVLPRDRWLSCWVIGPIMDVG